MSRILPLAFAVTAGAAALAYPAAAAEVSTLERAYLKEVAFLKAQKAEMEQQATRTEKDTERMLKAAKDEVDGLAARVVELRKQAELSEEQLRDAPSSKTDKFDVVYDSVTRARDISGDELKAVVLPKDRQPTNDELGAAVTTSFEAVAKAIREGAEIKREAGVFYGLDGKQIDGQLIKIGRVAAYGVSDSAAGALVPAGEGRTRLFPVPADQAARELAKGGSPLILPIFLVENFDDQVASGKDIDLTKEVQAAQGARTKKEGGLVKTLMSLPIFEAEWVLYLLIVMSVVSLGVMVERYAFYRKHKVDIDDIRLRLKEFLSRGDFAGAAQYLSKYDSLETNVILFGLREHQTGPDSVEDLLRGAEAKEKLRYNRYLGFLATVGSNSPFIGLFGTVLGIIRAFADLAVDVGGAGGSVMGGISEALISTAVGLLVAIPAVIAYNAFSGKMKTILANTELLTRTLTSALKAHEGTEKAA